MTGIVTDDDGTPVPGATVTVLLDLYSGPSVLTDVAGHYSIDFTSFPGAAWPGGFRGAPGTEEAVAFAQVDAPGYERYARYVLGTTGDLVENIHLHRVMRITGGESAVLTIAPVDTVCAIDSFPGRDSICGIVRVVVPSNGTMRVGVIPTHAGAALPVLTVYGGRTGGGGNPTSIRVATETEYTVNVGVPWGVQGSQSFVVQTSMVR